MDQGLSLALSAAFATGLSFGEGDIAALIEGYDLYIDDIYRLRSYGNLETSNEITFLAADLSYVEYDSTITLTSDWFVDFMVSDVSGAPITIGGSTTFDRIEVTSASKLLFLPLAAGTTSTGTYTILDNTPYKALYDVNSNSVYLFEKGLLVDIIANTAAQNTLQIDFAGRSSSTYSTGSLKYVNYNNQAGFDMSHGDGDKIYDFIGTNNGTFKTGIPAEIGIRGRAAYIEYASKTENQSGVTFFESYMIRARWINDTTVNTGPIVMAGWGYLRIGSISSLISVQAQFFDPLSTANGGGNISSINIPNPYSEGDIADVELRVSADATTVGIYIDQVWDQDLVGSTAGYIVRSWNYATQFGADGLFVGNNNTEKLLHTVLEVWFDSEKFNIDENTGSTITGASATVLTLSSTDSTENMWVTAPNLARPQWKTGEIGYEYYAGSELPKYGRQFIASNSDYGDSVRLPLDTGTVYEKPFRILFKWNDVTTNLGTGFVYYNQPSANNMIAIHVSPGLNSIKFSYKNGGAAGSWACDLYGSEEIMYDPPESVLVEITHDGAGNVTINNQGYVFHQGGSLGFSDNEHFIGSSISPFNATAASVEVYEIELDGVLITEENNWGGATSYYDAPMVKSTSNYKDSFNHKGISTPVHRLVFDSALSSQYGTLTTPIDMSGTGVKFIEMICLTEGFAQDGCILGSSANNSGILIDIVSVQPVINGVANDVGWFDQRNQAISLYRLELDDDNNQVRLYKDGALLDTDTVAFSIIHTFDRIAFYNSTYKDLNISYLNYNDEHEWVFDATDYGTSTVTDRIGNNDITLVGSPKWEISYDNGVTYDFPDIDTFDDVLVQTALMSYNKYDSTPVSVVPTGTLVIPEDKNNLGNDLLGNLITRPALPNGLNLTGQSGHVYRSGTYVDESGQSTFAVDTPSVERFVLDTKIISDPTDQWSIEWISGKDGSDGDYNICTGETFGDGTFVQVGATTVSVQLKPSTAAVSINFACKKNKYYRIQKRPDAGLDFFEFDSYVAYVPLGVHDGYAPKIYAIMSTYLSGQRAGKPVYMKFNDGNGSIYSWEWDRRDSLNPSQTGGIEATISHYNDGAITATNIVAPWLGTFVADELQVAGSNTHLFFVKRIDATRVGEYFVSHPVFESKSVTDKIISAFNGESLTSSQSTGSDWLFVVSQTTNNRIGSIYMGGINTPIVKVASGRAGPQTGGANEVSYGNLTSGLGVALDGYIYRMMHYRSHLMIEGMEIIKLINSEGL